MFGHALRDGLRAWARAPISVGFATMVTLGVLIGVYAAVIQFSPDLWITLAAWAIFANLALAGWGLFCAVRVDGDPIRWAVLFDGVRRPLALTAAGLVVAASVGAPIFVAAYVPTLAGGPDWLPRLLALLVACATAPAGWFVILEATAGADVSGAVSRGLANAYRAWPALTMLALLTGGLAMAGLVPGLLLEQHALTQIAALLPTAFVEYDLAVARLLALIGGLASFSAAGCIWAAAWRASGGSPSLRRQQG